MKTITFYMTAVLLLVILLTSCYKEDANRFRPGSATSEQPIEPSGPDYTKLTASNHPRILMHADDFTALKSKIAAGTDANLNLLHNTIMTLCASKGMASSALTYTLDASKKRILDVSRNALLRIFTCAYAYNMTGDSKYLTHAENDIKMVCTFSDWNSKRHFLDVGEMSVAVALGYDWLYNELGDDTRAAAEKALQNYAFSPALNKEWNLDFYAATNNWNQVCNGGLVCGALAIYEKCSKVAKQIIEKAISSNQAAMNEMYSPDGNYPEGPGYWNYGTLYESLMLAAMDSALGSDSNLSESAGFSKTAKYMLFMNGLNSKFFNYSDCAPSSTPAYANWYFADKFKDPSLLYNELRILQNSTYSNCDESRLLPMVMAFAGNINLSSVVAPADKIWNGNGITPVVIVHSDWTWGDTDKYLGIKGGKASTSHGHMDAGSFVYDAYGVRWSMDLGMQSYTTLETPLSTLGGNLWDMTQSSMRWDVLRLNNMNHSTITINGAKHLVNGAAKISSVINTATEQGAMLDLSAVVSDQAASANRTVKIVNDKNLVVVDEIKALSTQTAKVRWTMVTPAIPTIESSRIVLVFNNRTMYLSTMGNGASVTYKTWSTTSNNSYDAANPGTYEVGFEAIVPVNQTATFTTTLSPNEN